MTPVRQNSGAPRLTVIVPCYNEIECLEETASVLRALLASLAAERQIATESSICFVDDGSRDETWTMIARLANDHPEITGLKLSRNFGHQGAVLAGMLESSGDALVTIDADLQDDEGAIRDMIALYLNGYDVVLGVRKDRSADTWAKRFFAESYYRLLRAMGVRTVFNHADYRLMSRKAVEALRDFPEANLFLRGIINLIGFESTTVEYVRRERSKGTSKYPIRKMLSLAWEGITSFSVVPMRLVSMIGLAVALVSALVTLWAVYVRLTGSYVPGWASTVVPMYFLGGVQILCLGIIGEYVGKIYLETKRRPRYLVDQLVGAQRERYAAKRVAGGGAS